VSTHALVLFEAIVDRVRTLQGWKTIALTPMYQIQPEELPRLAVYFLREHAVADGDMNCGEPKFQHTVTIGFSGAIVGQDDGQQLINLDTSMSQLNDLLLTDPHFVRGNKFLRGVLDNNIFFEGIPQMDRQMKFSQIGEQMVAEIQFEMDFMFRSVWPPRVDDALVDIAVTYGQVARPIPQ
jgi:hypothetical protein